MAGGSPGGTGAPRAPLAAPCGHFLLKIQTEPTNQRESQATGRRLMFVTVASLHGTIFVPRPPPRDPFGGTTLP